MKEAKRSMIILHMAVFLAGWTGLFGRLITLSGLPLVWYRIMVGVLFLTLLMPFYTRLMPAESIALNLKDGLEDERPVAEGKSRIENFCNFAWK